MTRTRKVRRGIVAERYASLIEGLYGGKDSAFVEIEVTYEDGRKGKISGTLEIRDVRTFPRRDQTGAGAVKAA
jgi:long-chain acyl-CoA synthetase